MAFIGPNSPGMAADDSTITGDSWTSPTNAEAADGSYANVGDTNPANSHYLKVTNYGFSVPAGSDIQGIEVDVLRHASSNGVNNVTDNALKIVKADGSYGVLNKADMVDVWPTSDTTATYGGSTDLWGETWTADDVNNSNFGVGLSVALNPDTSVTAFVDYISITVFYSVGANVSNINLQKRYAYKVYDSTGTFLGRLPRPTSLFKFSQDINTAGTSIVVQLPVAADISNQPTDDDILDESGGIVEDEGSDSVISDGANLILGLGGGSDLLIKNGNEVVVWEYSYYHPNGIIVFRGKIKRWEANFGGDGGSETIDLTIYSDGQDTSNHLIRGYGLLVLDQSQATQDTNVTVTNNPGTGFTLIGQTFKTGSGIINIGAITIHAAAISTSNTVTIHLCLSPGGTEIASVSKTISSTSAADYQFVFASPIAVSPSTTYFFRVSTNTSSGISVYIKNSNVYANGSPYLNTGSGWLVDSSQDFYFKTYTAPLSTIATYTSQDPTTGILEPIMNAYAAEGGVIAYNSDTIDATGLSISYGFNTNTVLEGIQAMLTVSPNGFYWYVDLGTNLLYFKQASNSADIVLTKGKHTDQVKIVASIEYLVNQAFFAGGVVAGANIYTLDQDNTSMSQYGVALERLNDNRVTDTTTAHAIGSADVAENKDEQFMTQVTVVDKTIDTTLFKPGLIIGFNGFGTFVDGMLAQIVHIDYTPETVSLQLGLLPKRIVTKVEQVSKQLIAMATLDNPSGPS